MGEWEVADDSIELDCNHTRAASFDAKCSCRDDGTHATFTRRNCRAYPRAAR